MKLRLPNKLVAAILAAASPVLFSTLSTATMGAAAVYVAGQQAAAFEPPADANYGEYVTATAGNTSLTLAQDTIVYVEAGLNQDGGKIAINAQGEDVKVIPMGANQQLALGRLVASSVWLAGGRFRVADGGLFNKNSEIYVGGAQLWFTGDANYTGDNAIASNLYLGAASFNEGIGSLDYSSLRIGKNVDLNGAVSIASEGSKISFQNGGSTLTLNGALKGSGNLSLSVYNNANVTLAVKGDTTAYTGAISTTYATVKMLFGGGSESVNKTHTIAAVNSTGTVQVDENTTLELFNGNSVISTLVLNGGLTVKDNAALSFVNSSGEGAIVVRDGGRLSATSSLTHAGGITIAGGGILDFSGVTLSAETAAVSGGNLTFENGSLLGLSMQQAQSTGSYKIFGDGTYTGAAQLGFAVDGMVTKRVSGAIADGVLTITSAAANYTDLVWNGGAETHTWNGSEEVWTHGGGSVSFLQGDSVTFNSAANLTLKQNVRVGTLSVGNNASVNLNIATDATLSGTLSVAGGSSLKLDGSGTYVLPAATAAFGATLADTWTGTVAVNRGSNTVMNVSDFDFDAYGHAGSTVEVTALKGHMKRSSNTINSNLVFKNSPNGNLCALEISNGYGGAEYTFNGSISGSGNLVLGACGNGSNTINFKGNMSEWTGRLHFNNGTRIVNFSDAASQLNAELYIEGGTTTINSSNNLAIKQVTAVGGTASIAGSEAFSINQLDISGGAITISGTGNTCVKQISSTGGTLTLTGNVDTFSLYQKVSTVNIGTAAATAVVTAGRLESGDVGSGTAVLNVNAGTVLKVTGSDMGADGNSTSYKQSGVVLGEWGASTTMSVSGTFLSPNATLQPGDTGYTLNIEGTGVVAAKGIGNPTTKKSAKNQAITVNINSGKLVLGSGGIDSTHNNVTTNIKGNSTLGVMAESVAINKTLTLKENAVLTLNTNMHTVGDSSLTEGTAGGSLVFNSAMSTESNTRINVTGSGKVALNVASALGSAAVSVAEGGTLELLRSDALSASQTVSNSGSVVLHSALTSGTVANAGTIVLAADFADIAGTGYTAIENVSAEGNGFTAGMTATVLNGGSVTGTQSVVYGGQTAEIAANGTISFDTDWSTYHINNALGGTETFGAMKAAATEHSAVLQRIDVAATSQTLKVDADGLATSMLSGAGAAGTTLDLATGTTLTVDTATMQALTAADDATVTLNMAESATLNLTGASALNVTGTEKSNTLALGNGTMNRTLTITNATVTSARAENGTGFNTGTTMIGAGGTLSLTAAKDALGWSSPAGTITLLGEENNLATLELGGRQTLKTNIVMQGNSIIKPTAAPAGSGSDVPALDPYNGGTLTVSGTNNVISTNIRQRDAFTITVNEGAELTVTGTITRDNANSAGFTKAGAGTLTFLNTTGGLQQYTANAGDTVFDNSVFSVDKHLDISNGGSARGSVILKNGASLNLATGVDLWMNEHTSLTMDRTSTVVFTRNDYVLSVAGAEAETLASIASPSNASYQLDNAFVVSHALVSMKSSVAKTMNTKFVDSSIVNEGSGALTLSNAANTAFTAVHAKNGNITLNAATSIGDLTIAGGKTVTASAEGALSVTSVLSAGAGATLSSALSLAADSVLDLVTGDNALSLDSHAVTFAKGVTLSETMMDSVAALQSHQALTLFKNVTALTGGTQKASSVFAGLTGDYVLKVQGSDLVIGKAGDLVWQGGDGTWGGDSTPWTDAGASSAFIEGSHVTISGNGGTISVSGAQSAYSATIAHSGYTINANSGASLSILGDLTVSEGVSATLGFLPTVGGNIVVESEASLDLKGAGMSQNVLYTAFEKGTGNGKIVLVGGGGGDLQKDLTTNVNIEVDGSLWLNGRGSGKTITVANGKTLFVKTNLNMGNYAHITVDGGTLEADKILIGHSDGNYPATLTLTDGAITVTSFEPLRDDNTNTIAINGGTLTIKGENAFAQSGASTTVTLGAAILTNGEADMAFNHASTMTGTTVTAKDGTTITVGGDGMTTNVVTSLTTNGNVVMAGTTSIAANATLTTNGTLGIDKLDTVSAATLTFAGTGSTTISALADGAAVGPLNLQSGSDVSFGAADATIQSVSMHEGVLSFTNGTNLITGDLKAETNTGDLLHSAVNISGEGTSLTVNGNLRLSANGMNVTVGAGAALELGTAKTRIEALGGEAAVIKNETTASKGYYTYSNDNNVFSISNARVTYTDGAANNKELAEKLVNSAVVNNSGKAQILNNANNTLVGVHAESGNVTVKNAAKSAETLQSIKAEGGDVTVTGLVDAGAALSLSLNELAIADGKTVSALTSGTAHTESHDNAANIVVSGKLTVGEGATLNANLTMQSGSTTSMANGSSLNMGCALTLNKGMNLADDDATESAMSTLESVQATGYNTRWLYTSVDSLTLVDFNGSGNDFVLTDANIGTFNGIDASTYFNNLTSGVYFLTAVANEQQGGWDIGITAPEPTTSALSLLALAGLAARRRRK